MSFEKKMEGEILDAKSAAPLKSERDLLNAIEFDAHAKFIKGEYDIQDFKEIIQSLPENGGRVYFNTLPEFIVAVRKIIPDKKVQDEILDHENAHASEADQRGYSFKYVMEFVKDVRNMFIVKLVKTYTDSAGVKIDYFSKSGPGPSESELREDLIAIITAPERLSSTKLSKGDEEMLGR